MAADQFPCETCGNSFDSFKKMRIHEMSHRKRYCSFCQLAFSQNSLARHEQFCTKRPENPSIDSRGDCTHGYLLRHLFRPDDFFFTQAVRYFEDAEHFQRSPDLSLVFFNDGKTEPALARSNAIGDLLIHHPRGLTIIPTMALNTANNTEDSDGTTK